MMGSVRFSLHGWSIFTQLVLDVREPPIIIKRYIKIQITDFAGYDARCSSSRELVRQQGHETRVFHMRVEATIQGL